jgi:hypothetical protein
MSSGCQRFHGRRRLDGAGQVAEVPAWPALERMQSLARKVREALDGRAAS